MTVTRIRQSALCVTILSLLTTTTRAFSFSFTNSLSQCSQVTAQWNGGQPPFTLLLVPTGHLTSETRTIIQENVPSGNSVSFKLNYPAQSQFVAVLSDATGIRTGGTSVITTVGGSSDSSCLNTQQVSPKFFFFQSPTSVSQCANIALSVGTQAQAPIDILGIVPGGQSFDIANLTSGATSTSWQADVRSGTNLLFVAGDKDGLGSGGSTDVLSVGNGDSSCINSQSPSSTAGPAAGGVSTAASGGQTGGSGGGTTGGGTAGSPTQTGGSATGTNPQNPTGSGGTNSPGNGGNPSGTGTNGSPGSTGTGGSNGGGGGTGTGGNDPGQTGSGGGHNDPGSSSVPGSGGGTVTGSVGSSTKNHNNAGLIAGLVIAALALLGLIIGGVILYRRRARRANTYNNLENNTTRTGQPSFTGPRVVPHLRGGAASASTDTLQSMFQAEPFILPAEYNPYAEHDERAPLTQRNNNNNVAAAAAAQGQTGDAAPTIARPNLAARVSSGRSFSAFLSDVPYARSAFGGGLLGMHGPPTQSSTPQQGATAVTDRKESIGPHGEAPSRTPSGRTIPLGQRTGNRGMPPPISTTEPVPRVARDSEDFSPISFDDEPPSDPFGDDEEVVDIPPTYHSVQAVAASRQNSVLSHAVESSAEDDSGHDAAAQAPMTRTLSRSNAVSRSRGTRRASTRSLRGFRPVGSDDAH